MEIVKDYEVLQPKFLKQKWRTLKRIDELCAAMNKTKSMGLNLLSFLMIFVVNCKSPEVALNEPEVIIHSEISSPENQFSAKVIRIIDGDTLEVLYGELPIKLRLEHIDCPEKRGKQPFGNAAKQTLSDLCFGQMVEIIWSSKDRNGRYISVVFNENDLNVNQEMVRLGMAWHYKKYSKDNSYAELENTAQNNKVGLWQDPNPIAPWDWRK